MADKSLQFLWPRLGEGYKNMVARLGHFLGWCEDFSWKRVDILDMLFLGWILVAFVVVGVVNLYLRFFGVPKKGRGPNPQDAVDSAVGARGSHGSSASVAPGGGESCQWLNAAVSWIYLHYDQTPELVDCWIRALNEQARKHTNEVQLKFERIQAGSLPPKLTRIATDISTQESLSLRMKIECSDLLLLASASQQNMPEPSLVNWDITIRKLQGELRVQLKVHSNYTNDEMQVLVTHVSPPQLELSVRPRSHQTNVDPKVVQDIVEKCINGSTTRLALPSQGDSMFTAPVRNFIQPQSMLPSQAMQHRRLLVKMIKANGLADKEFAQADSYCVVRLDFPSQSHRTSLVKNTINPFWDEHFIFDLDKDSKQLNFDVFDDARLQGEFLGHALISMDDLKKMTSSRQIIPLTGRTNNSTATSGSITVEFLFMEPDMNNVMDAPRRYIETSRSFTSGGTLVTTTTTTTERMKDQKMETRYNEEPNMIEKAESAADYSPYSSQVSSQLGAHEAGLSVSQAGGAATLTSPKLTVTKPTKSATLPEPAIPIIKDQPESPNLSEMTRSPQEEGHDTLSMSTNGSADHKATSISDDSRDGDVKKSRSFASKLKGRFHRSKKSRSQSADRASSVREGSLLRPPNQQHLHAGSRTAEDTDGAEVPQGRLRKSRSHSLSNSLRRIFKKKERGKGDASRESSVSRASGRVSREGSVSQASPGGGQDNYAHGNQADFSQDGYAYSSSVPPAKSPLAQQH